jgi:hypothetical protein
LSRGVEPLVVHLLAPAVSVADAAERHDPPTEEPSFLVRFRLVENGPVLPSPPSTRDTRGWPCHVQKEDAPGGQYPAYTPKERGEPTPGHSLVERVVDHLTKGCDGLAPGEVARR